MAMRCSTGAANIVSGMAKPGGAASIITAMDSMSGYEMIAQQGAGEYFKLWLNRVRL